MDDLKLCPKFESAFELLGKRWTGLIIRVMLSGKRRFSDISAMIPHLSDRMLVERLKELETAGIVDRHVYPEMPIRVEYELTEKGRQLEPAMDQIQKWADKWVEKINE
ncbi:helix-turn-helix transcriptional regulator [Alicyclobacillus fastidiosus]|uniref:Helix-turn-helix transcriptional regulator n=1 Tax=Alicyclobacillus fastidiosus TaxID=392011 RepID=A0ABY6ZCL0_9BACL|nr:helix-turn-helix domain-containing protein [Alicyclobacillus fastidiosus]WAH40278.1 helix-turn-helix transcriptional regulator [Alicyclobacillus fastidiosus]GMA61654.1 transcriptional regulator [Alicyclobacillus fastidiosus]